MLAQFEGSGNSEGENSLKRGDSCSRENFHPSAILAPVQGGVMSKLPCRNGRLPGLLSKALGVILARDRLAWAMLPENI